MDESGWLACADPRALLEGVRGRVSERKLRLVAAAGYRRNWFLVFNRVARWAADVVDRYAEGTATEAEWSGAWTAVGAHRALGEDAWQAAASTLSGVSRDPSVPLDEWWREEAAQVALLRCVLGNPFRPVALDPGLLTPAVVSLARAAYAERQLPGGHLDPARLAVLADALEEAGCTQQEVLAHLRGPGPHVRGCHVLDQLTGRA